MVIKTKKTFWEKLGIVELKKQTKDEMTKENKMYGWIALFMFAGCILISGMTNEISFVAIGIGCACLMFTSISLNRDELRRREIAKLKHKVETNWTVMYQLLEHHGERLSKLEQTEKTVGNIIRDLDEFDTRMKNIGRELSTHIVEQKNNP